MYLIPSNLSDIDDKVEHIKSARPQRPPAVLQPELLELLLFRNPVSASAVTSSSVRDGYVKFISPSFKCSY